MSATARVYFWRTVLPTAWKTLPGEMTVSTLSRLEACPRRWTLESSDYSQIWSGRGYPPRIQLKSVSGTVVHRAVELVTKELIGAGCTDVQDPASVAVMRRLGGYTKILQDALVHVLGWFANNPRAEAVREEASRLLYAQVPALRAQVQSLLNRAPFSRGETSEAHSGGGQSPRPLTAGVFPEQELRASEIGWKGVIDLLVLSDELAEIVDFKTGAPHEHHKFQVSVYALLWLRDRDRNPSCRLIERLSLVYPNGKVTIPGPSLQELRKLEVELLERSEIAVKAVSCVPAEARRSPENCGHCSVRQLCGDYWVGMAPGETDLAGDGRRYVDFEATVLRRHGVASWDVVIEKCAVHTTRQALMRESRQLGIEKGQRVRVLDARLDEPEDNDSSTTIFTVGTYSEAFTVED